MRRLEACQSPVWDTVLSMIALEDAGLEPDHPALTAPRHWVLDEEIRQPGDWQVRRPHTAPGGWAFEFENDNYADTDDTAEVVLALRRSTSGSGRRTTAPRSAAACAGSRACSARTAAGARSTPTTPASWSTSCRSATSARSSTRRAPTSPRTSWRRSPPRAWPRETACRRGVIWLLKNQEQDGSWFGRWGANYLYGTGAVVPALIAAGRQAGQAADPPGGRLARVGAERRRRLGRGPALLRRPRRSGPAGARPPPRRPRGRCSRCSRRASATARRPSAASAGWRRRSARTAPGTSPTSPGPASRGDFYLNYHLYRLAFPVSALGRYVRGTHA